MRKLGSYFANHDDMRSAASAPAIELAQCFDSKCALDGAYYDLPLLTRDPYQRSFVSRRDQSNTLNLAELFGERHTAIGTPQFFAPWMV